MISPWPLPFLAPRSLRVATKKRADKAGALIFRSVLEISDDLRHALESRTRCRDG